MFSNMPPITKALLIANGLVFVLQLMLGDAIFAPFMLWPLGGDGLDMLASGGTPGFLPWHRAYLLDLERELQAIDPGNC